MGTHTYPRQSPDPWPEDYDPTECVYTHDVAVSVPYLAPGKTLNGPDGKSTLVLMFRGTMHCLDKECPQGEHGVSVAPLILRIGELSQLFGNLAEVVKIMPPEWQTQFHWEVDQIRAAARAYIIKSKGDQK